MSSDPNQPPPQYPPAYYPPPMGYYPPPAHAPALPPPPPPPVDRTNTHLLAFIAALIAAPLIGAVLYFGIKGYERERDRKEVLRLEHEETLLQIEQLKVEEKIPPGVSYLSDEYRSKIKPYEEKRHELLRKAEILRDKHGWWNH